MTRQLHEIDSVDVMANTGAVDVLDYQAEAEIVVFRNARETKVVLHDQPNGAMTVTATPKDGPSYFLYLPPAMPFDTLIKMMEHL